MRMKTLFITTKNIDYIRNSQEIRLLERKGKTVTQVYSCRHSYLVRLLELYVRLLFFSMRGYDEVFIGFAPQLILPFWGWKFRKQRITIDFFISVYDTFVNDRKKVKADSTLARLMHWLDRATFEKADQVIADTKADAEYFLGEFGSGGKAEGQRRNHKEIKRQEKVQVLYLEADTEFYYPRDDSRPPQLSDRFIVLYFGSILPLQGVDIILKALEQLKKEKNLFFYMIGPLGKKETPVVSDNIEYIDWLPQDKLAEYIARADLCLAGHFNGEIDKAKRTIPGKTYIYRAMEKPVVLGDSPANRELFDEMESGVYFVPMGNPEALAGRILEISNAERRAD